MRGKGIGKALINALYDKARAAGSSRVYWHTHESNATAMRLYDTLGDRSGFVVYRKDLYITAALNQRGRRDEQRIRIPTVCAVLVLRVHHPQHYALQTRAAHRHLERQA